MKSKVLLLIAALACASGTTHASLLVYDGYSYTAGTLLNGTNPGPNTVGLNTAVAYGGSAANSYSVVANSLSFSNLVTTGGALSFSGGTNVIAGPVSLGTGSSSPYTGASVYSSSSPYVGTLYSSYLLRLTITPASTTAFETRVADSAATLNMRFITAPDSRVSGNSFSSVSYDNGDVGTIPTLNNSTLSINTTYLVISRFTGVGSPLTGIDQATATMYILTSAQFDSFISGGADSSYLDGTALGTGASQITARINDNNNNTTGTPDFGNTSFVQYLAISSGGTVDETRYGTTLGDVIPLIPEPSSIALAVAGGCFLFGRRRR